jgi:hypothetical protein
MRFLFCADPLAPREPDAAFATEASAVRELGVPLALVDYERLEGGDAPAAVRRVPRGLGETAVYRGWMLRPEGYRLLYDALAARGAHLVNDPEAYARAHCLPGWYPALEGHTPRSVWMPLEGDVAMDDEMALLRPFGDAPLVLKDWVKSRKHEWAEACFIPSASDRGAVERVVRRFLELQGGDLVGGLVFREHVRLVSAGRHPKSGMPLSREIRLFFLDGEVVAAFPYWDEVDDDGAMPPLDPLRDLARRVQTRFLTMDVAALERGGWIVLEIGDGQVSGLPDRADRRAFYRELAKRLGRPAEPA